MKKILFILFLTCSFSMLCAQDVEYSRSIMKKVMEAPDLYSYASYSADSLELARIKAVELLGSQIVTEVKVSSNTSIGSTHSDGDINSYSVFEQVAKTFTNVRLSDYQTLIIDKPQKKNKKYTVFVYISKERIREILEEIEDKEREAFAERTRQTEQNVRFYYTEGCKAIKDVRIGDALKYLYWGYIISLGTKVDLVQDGKTVPATGLIEVKIDEVLAAIRVKAISFEKIKINDLQEKFKVILDIEYVENGQAQKVTNLDYIYHDGNSSMQGPRVRDGIGTLDLQYDVDEVRVYCVYKYEENETPPEIYELVKNKGVKRFASAEKVVTIPQAIKGENAEPFVAESDEKQLFQDSLSSEVDALGMKETSGNHEEMLNRMYAIESAIRTRNYDSVRKYFTAEGYDGFKKLIQYGNASIIGVPQYRFLDFGNLTLCRSITMQFRFRNNKQFIEHVTFRFNGDNIVESLAFTLSDVAESDILEKGDWALDSRLTLMTFLEDYQTAYALGRIDYLERIFSENALIIVGNKVEQKKIGDGVVILERVKYDTLSKPQYMSRLRRHFNTKEYINLNFTETDFERASNGKFFGIRVRQEYFSNTYGDVGYLFLLVDLRFDEPIIHIRAWQNDKLPLESLIGLTDFY